MFIRNYKYININSNKKKLFQHRIFVIKYSNLKFKGFWMSVYMLELCNPTLIN